MAKRDVTFNVNVPVNVSGEARIASLERELDATREKADRLQSSLNNAISEIDGLVTELERVKESSGIDILEAELKRFKNTATQSLMEFRSYLESVNLNDVWGNNDEQFRHLFEQIKDGSMTAQQAIQKVKIEYDYLLREFRDNSSGAFDSQMIQQFALSMDTLANKIEEVLNRIARIETEGVKTVGGVASGGGGGASIASISEIFDQVRDSAERMSEAANGSITSVSNLVGALKDYSEIDSTKLLAISQAFRNMADLGTGSFSAKSIDNLVYLAKQVSALNQSGSFSFRFDLEGLKDFKVSSTIHHLTDFLSALNDGQISSLERLSRINLSNFHQDNLKISKATADNLAEMVKVEQAQHQEAEAVKQTDAAYQEHQKEVEAAAKAEEEKAKISELLAKALEREEERTKSASKASKEHADAVEKQMDAMWAERRAEGESLNGLYDSKKVSSDLAEMIKLKDAEVAAAEKAQRAWEKEEQAKLAAEEKAAKAAEEAARRKEEADRRAAEAAEKAAQKRAEAEARAAEKALREQQKLEEAQRKAEQLAAYKDASRTVNRYYGLLTSKDTNASKRQDVTMTEAGWVSASGKYAELAAQLNDATAAYNMLTDAQNKNGMSAEQVAEINSIIATRQKDYNLAVENAAAKEQESAQRAAESARAKEQQAEETRKAKEAKQQEAEATKAQANAEKEEAAARKEAERSEREYASTLKQINNAIVQCENAQRKYAAAAKLGVGKEDYSKIQNASALLVKLRDELERTGAVTPEISAKFRRLSEEVSTASANLKTNGNLLGRWATTGVEQLKSRLTYSLGLAAMVYKAAGEIKKMISTAVELDTAMNQLQIVTRSSAADMDVYAKRVSAMAKETGQATKDLIDASTVYARLGYSMEDSAVLSKYTAMLQGVGDIEAGAAQDAMTAILKAFDKDVNDVEDVMNKLVVVGNNFPVSVSDLAEGMNNAGSMLAVAGNSLEESIALLTAANTTVQNISKASTGLRTIAARIRKMETEDGEIVEESKYNEMIDALTRHNVQLVDANGEYRKTYDIIKDIAAVWKDMSTMQQAAVVEALAGTRQQNIFASLMTQFGEAEEAVERMKDSAGELEEAYSIRMSSIQAHVNTMKAAFVEMSMDFLDSDLAKRTVDLLTKIIEAIDTIINEFGVLGVAITGIMSTGLIKAVMTGSLAAGFSGIAKALSLVKAAVPELVILAAAIGAVTLAYKKYKEAHPSFDDLKSTATTARSDADEAAKAYEDAAKQLDENKKKLKELQTLAANGKITRVQLNEIGYLEDQNARYEEQIGYLERKAQLAKEAADAAQREAANAKYNEMFSSKPPSTVSYLPGGWDRAGGDANVVLGGRVPEAVNAKEKVDELIGAYEYSIAEVRVITENINERLKSDSEEVKESADSMVYELDTAKGKLEDTRKALLDYATDLYALRDLYEGLEDENSLERVAEIDELLGKINKALPKTDKSLATFKNNLKQLDSTIKNKLAKDINDLTNEDLKAFQRWLDDCGYSIDEFQNLLRDLADEMQPDVSTETFTSKQISEWATMTDEIRKAQAALEDYQEAMKGGNNDEMAKAAQAAWKTAMEDIASGRIDSKAVWAFAELAMSPQQLAQLGYDAERIANVIKSSFYKSLFDDDNAENGFSDEDNKYGYGQRLLKMLEERQGELPGVKVWRDASGGIQYTIDDFSELAKQLDISEALLDIMLHDLEAYGKELLTDTTQNTKLVESLQYYTSNVKDAKEATRQFIREAFKNDEDLTDSTMWRILNGLHDQGHLQLDPSEYYDLIREVRDGLEAEGAEEDLTVQPRADDTLLMEDIDSMIDNCQKLLDNKTLKAHIEADSNDAVGAADNSPEAVAARNEELRKQLEEDAALYEEKVKNLYATFGDLVDETGSARTAVKLLVDQLRGVGMSDAEIEGILESFRSMGLAIIPTLEDIDAEASELQGTLNGLDNTDAKPQVNLNTSAAYRALNSMVADLNSVSQRTWTINLGAGVYGTASKITSEGKSARSRAQGGVTGKAGPTLVNELGAELISDKGRAFIANNGEPGFVSLSKDAIVFTAEETKEIAKKGGLVSGAHAYADGTRKGLIGRLLSDGDVPARASGWTCPFCGRSNPSTVSKCRGCGKDPRNYKPTAVKSTAQQANQQAKINYTSTTTSTKLSSTTPGKTVKTTTTSTTWWYCSNCGRANPSSSSRCEYCGTSKGGALSSAVDAGKTAANTTLSSKLGITSSYPSVQSANYNELFNFGDDGSAGGGGGGGAASESRSNPQKIDWIAVKLNRIQREITDLEKVASSGLKKLSTRLDAAKNEASKLNEEIGIAQSGYNRYIQEANNVGLRSDLTEKVRNGTIDINEYDDEELRQQIQEYQEWYATCRPLWQHDGLSSGKIGEPYGEIYGNTEVTAQIAKGCAVP